MNHLITSGTMWMKRLVLGLFWASCQSGESLGQLHLFWVSPKASRSAWFSSFSCTGSNTALQHCSSAYNDHIAPPPWIGCFISEKGVHCDDSWASTSQDFNRFHQSLFNSEKRAGRWAKSDENPPWFQSDAWRMRSSAVELPAPPPPMLYKPRFGVIANLDRDCD